ncbi:glycosyltransferase family 4 protein [Ferruginibacter profundus]
MKPATTIKLFLDAHIFDGEFQGSRTFIKELYNILLHKKELELYIAAYDIENLQQYFPKAENVFFIRLKSRSSIRRLLFDIPLLIKKYGIHYAHFQYMVPVIKNCRFIVTTHDVLFNEYPKEFPLWYRLSKNFLYKKAAKKADILTTDSDYSKKSIQKYLHVPANKVNVIRLGINASFFEPYDQQTAKDFIKNKYGFDKYILFVSRREPRKNHTLLLKAYLDLKLYEAGYHLVFIGHESITTPEFDGMLNALSQTIRAFIIFNEKASDEDLLNFYKAAAVFVYPSKAEGFGLPPLEAGALKIPVVCSDSSALGDFTFFGKHHVNTGNYIAFKNALYDVLANKPDNNSLAAIAATIQQQYNWQNTADHFYRLLQQNSMS